MKIDHLCSAKFTWTEVQGILADVIEMEANDQVQGSPENQRLLKIAEKARGPYSCVETDEDGLILMIDGVAYEEDFGR
jgi:hypothetical protein